MLTDRYIDLILELYQKSSLKIKYWNPNIDGLIRKHLFLEIFRKRQKK